MWPCVGMRIKTGIGNDNDPAPAYTRSKCFPDARQQKSRPCLPYLHRVFAHEMQATRPVLRFGKFEAIPARSHFNVGYRVTVVFEIRFLPLHS